jgi:hypothetical protein
MVLQKERFFELLATKYWGYAQKCDDANSEDGITLKTLGSFSTVQYLTENAKQIYMKYGHDSSLE